MQENQIIGVQGKIVQQWMEVGIGMIYPVLIFKGHTSALRRQVKAFFNLDTHENKTKDWALVHERDLLVF